MSSVSTVVEPAPDVRPRAPALLAVVLVPADLPSSAASDGSAAANVGMKLETKVSMHARLLPAHGSAEGL
jgi:hypothetical protein